MVDLGITDCFLGEGSSVLGLKILVSFPQSRGGSSREHRCEGGGQDERAGAGSSV